MNNRDENSSESTRQCSAHCNWDLLKLVLLSLLSLIAVPQLSLGQAIESADRGRVSGWAGVSVSQYYFQYGESSQTGISGFIDIDTARRLGFEAEARRLVYHRAAQMRVDTYLIGPRYHVNAGRFQLYAKGLFGNGRFSFPNSYAHGNYYVVSAGGGVDYRLSRRFSLRIADMEYQRWPSFTFGPLSSIGASAGIRYRIR